MITFLKTMESLRNTFRRTAGTSNRKLSPMNNDSKPTLKDPTRKSGCHCALSNCRGGKDGLRSPEAQEFIREQGVGRLSPVGKVLEFDLFWAKHGKIDQAVQTDVESDPTPLNCLMEDILKSEDPQLIQRHLVEVVDCLKQMLNKLGTSSSKLERSKAELACERLQLISAINELRRNRRTEKAVRKERHEVRVRTAAILEIEITDVEEQLKSLDPHSYRKYSDITRASEAKSIYQKTLNKLTILEKLRVLLLYKMDIFEQKNKKKEASSPKSRHKSVSSTQDVVGLRRIIPRPPLRSRRQQDILECIMNVTEARRQGRITQVRETQI